MSNSTVDMSGALKKFKDLAKLKHEVMEPAADFFIKSTPVRTGNARSRTFLDAGNQKIEADYSYASVLDAGRGYRDGRMRGSMQAPDGMSKPTIKYLTKLINDYISLHGRKG